MPTDESSLTDEFRFLSPSALRADVWLPKRLRDLADDIERIANGDFPSPADLADAPLIDGWRTATTALGLRLVGHVLNHPVLGDAQGMTTQVWAADPDGKWVRTLSRFYALGEPEPFIDDDAGGPDV